MYFVNLGKWYAKVFLRKEKVTKTPYLTFEADSKIALIQKIDDHCLKAFGKVFRYKKLAHQEPMERKAKDDKPQKEIRCSCTSTDSRPDKVQKDGQEFTDGMLKLIANIVLDLHGIKIRSLMSMVVACISLAISILLILIR